MDFSRRVEVAAPFDEVWALVGDIPAAAGCIPGVRDLEMVSNESFTCTLEQKVGSVKAKFALKCRLTVDPEGRVVEVFSEGQDRGLASTVKASQRFTIAADSGMSGDTSGARGGGTTSVDIVADVQISGRIATFGHRIIGAKAEQVTVDAVRNVERLLAERRAR